MKTFAILIDAGFVKARLGSAASPVGAQGFKKLVEDICAHAILRDGYLYRVYFYDAPPFTKSKAGPDGKIRHFAASPLTKHNRQMLDELKSTERFALRIGEVRFRGWQLDQQMIKQLADPTQQGVQPAAEDFHPILQQKGVDMRIGLDIASLALKKQVDMLVLVSGDSDFVPPMKFARREGVQFAIVTLGQTVHPDLLEHADFSLTLP